jgi:hypothetical protein
MVKKEKASQVYPIECAKREEDVAVGTKLSEDTLKCVCIHTDKKVRKLYNLKWGMYHFP